MIMDLCFYNTEILLFLLVSISRIIVSDGRNFTNAPPFGLARAMRAAVKARNGKSGNKPTANKVEVCNNPKCKELAKHLLDAMDPTADPCKDFLQYSCGKWLKTAPARYPKLKRHENEIQEHLKDTINKQKSKPIHGFLKDVGGWPVLLSKWNEKSASLQRLFGKIFQLSQVLLSYEVLQSPFRLVLSVHTENTQLYHLDFHAHRTIIFHPYDKGTASETKLAAYKKLFTTFATFIAGDLKLNVDNKRMDLDWSKMIALETKLAILTPPFELISNFTVFDLMPIWTLDKISSVLNIIKLEKLLEDGMEPETFVKIVKGKSKSLRCMIHLHTYFSKLNDLLKSTDKRTLFNYFMWYFIYHSSYLLDTRFQSAVEDFRLNAFGIKADSRSSFCAKQCQSVEYATSALFIRKYFPASGKADVELLVAQIKKEIKKGLSAVTWMDAATKKKAMEKVDVIDSFVVYPDFVLNDQRLDRFYEKLKIKSSDTYSDMLMAVNAFNRRNALNMLSKPPDKSLLIDPLYMHAGYFITQNIVVIPIGLLQPTLYSGIYPKAYNFGFVGSSIATGYLDLIGQKGSFYDKVGNRARWWSTATAQNYETKGQCLSKWYKKWAKKPELQGTFLAKVDSSQAIYAFRAYKSYMTKTGQKPSVLPHLNITDDQLFYVSIGQNRCAKESPYSFDGVNARAANDPNFAKVFKCSERTMMNPKSRCIVFS